MTGEPFLEVRDLKTYYEDDGFFGGDPVRAVDGVSFDLERGETLGLVGESGCGKTTLGRTILGLTEPTAGTVEAGERDVTDLGGEERREWQRNAAMVFQDPEASLNDRMTVGEIVAEPLETHDWPFLTVAVEGASDAAVSGKKVQRADADEDNPDITVRLDGDDSEVVVRSALPLSAADVDATVDRSGDAPTVSVAVGRGKAEMRRERVFDLLDRVGLQEEHYYRYPHQFSGGQRQRVGIARALALEPEFLVLDEPVSALDVSVQARIINLLEDLQDELGLTYLFIAHDLSVVRHIADRVAVMYLGNVVEIGPTESVYADPAHPYTVSLLSAIPGSGSPLEGDRVTLQGSPPSPRDPPEGCPLATRCPAKIRPDGYELDEETWRALDALRVVFRQRARAERSVTELVKTSLGFSVDASALEEAVEELLGDRDLPGEVERVVDEAVDLARSGDDRAAADRLREAFGSECDESRPEPYDVADRRSRCFRHEPGYEGVRETIASRRGRGYDD